MSRCCNCDFPPASAPNSGRDNISASRWRTEIPVTSRSPIAPHESDGAQLHIRHVPGGDCFPSRCLPGSKKATSSRSNCLTEISTCGRNSAETAASALRPGPAFAPAEVDCGRPDQARQQARLCICIGAAVTQAGSLHGGAGGEMGCTAPDWFKFVPVLWQPDPDWTGATGLLHRAVLN